MEDTLEQLKKMNAQARTHKEAGDDLSGNLCQAEQALGLDKNEKNQGVHGKTTKAPQKPTTPYPITCKVIWTNFVKSGFKSLPNTLHDRMKASLEALHQSGFRSQRPTPHP